MLYTGTSGYAYKEWKGPFYPPDLAADAMLGYYATRLPSVEVNNSFYQMPKADTLARWAGEVPAHFRFAFKAPGRITHQKRLKDVADPTAYLWKTLATLGDRLGPLLVGLPPNMKKDVARLDAFLALCPPAARIAVEFRHESWLDDEVYAALRARGVALCVADAEELSVPLVSTAPWGYLRLRRPGYDDAALDGWAARAREAAWQDTFVFFKHEDAGAGPALAARFASMWPGG